MIGDSAFTLESGLIPFGACWACWLNYASLEGFIVVISGWASVANTIDNEKALSANTLDSIEDFIGFAEWIAGKSDRVENGS